MDIYYTSSDGLNLYAKSYGPDAAPLTALCMHGLTRNHKDFEPMIEALLKRGLNIRFIAVDVRGRCHSDADPNPNHYTPAIYAGDMVRLMDHLSLDKVVLIGTSMGGLMSMVLMSMVPDHILGVVLNDVGPVLEQKGLDRISGYVGGNSTQPDWDAAARAVSGVQATAFPDYTQTDWMAFAKRIYRETPDRSVTLDYDPAISRTVKDVRPNMFTRLAMWRLFKAMTKSPMLLIRGSLSDLLSEKTARKMIRKHGTAGLVTVPRVGHAPLLDEPDALNALAAFLKKLEPVT